MAPLLGLGLDAQVEFVSKIIFMRSPKPPSHNYKSLMISRLGCTKPHAVTRYISPSEVELPMGLREISQCPEKAPLATSLLGPSSIVKIREVPLPGLECNVQCEDTILHLEMQ